MTPEPYDSNAKNERTRVPIPPRPAPEAIPMGPLSAAPTWSEGPSFADGTPLASPAAPTPSSPLPPPPPRRARKRRPRPIPPKVLARMRRWHLDDPKGQLWNRGIGFALVLLGLSVAIVANANPEYQFTMLAPSGSFFALAEANNQLFAASSNGGSVILEKSADRGLTWSPSAVPYHAVAGGASWDLAVVAADGNHMLLTAASGLTTPPGTGGGSPGGCNQDSTILVATSQDEGSSWNARVVSTPGEVVTSLQASVEAREEAVAWIQQPVGPCGGAPGEVSAITSGNYGASWTKEQNLTNGTATLPSSEESLEMAPESQGIVMAFLETPNGLSSPELALWMHFPGSSGFGSGPLSLITPPASWTLQGDPDTPAVLITPISLTLLTGDPNNFTSLPFYQLQQDGGGLSQLPEIVSLVPLDGTTVEIAATMPKGTGVDCWDLNTLTFAISQACHVPLGSLLVPASEQFPIVSLLDGGGYWIAIGASGNPNCLDVCPQSTQNQGGTPTGGGTTPSAPMSGAAAVGTSICIEGCTSTQGLAAYAFTENAEISPALVSALSALIVIVGLAWIGTARRARRRIDAAKPQSPGHASTSANGGGLEPKRILSAYRRGLQVWALVWLPLALLSFVPSSGGAFGWGPWIAILGGTAGALLSMPYHAMVRRNLQGVYGVEPERFFTEDPETAGEAQDKVRLAALFAYASWFAGLAVVVLFLVAATGGFSRTDATVLGGMGPGSLLGGGAWALLVAVFGAVGLRLLYHIELSDAVALVRAEMTTGSEDAPLEAGVLLRNRVGSALLVCNPFVGLLVGWSLQPALPGAATWLPWAFLPTTLLGIAILLGLLGRSSWTVEPVTVPD
ncbi:MAG: hypothetical protein KGJ23_14590 [Euryarchaeota archaeon]|nr:hypothetical protein [Euryarchaeota archaeon]MDE1837828.1 hypothetical protein [Euryarchaeota archaeon]MDE1880102.1 hypothetical protein [Euryarchaeota archaeon]MDE2045060.1 hypothetical protein [Thermoplasmata archaeon]